MTAPSPALVAATPVAWCADCDAWTELGEGACMTCEAILDREAAWAAADAWTLDPYGRYPITETDNAAVYLRSRFA